MALIEETLFGTVDKVHDAIERLRAFEPKNQPYRLGFSGGKDSVVILALAKMAGVKFEAVYNVTSVDPPELVRFIKEKYPEVKREIPHDKDGKPITMWSLIRKLGLPPTRILRYCCRALKEAQGKNRVTVTGVRWAESVNRKLNQGLVTVMGRNVKDEDFSGTNHKRSKKGGIVMNDDNDEARRAVEVCYRTHKTLVNPIIDWTDDEVWEFIHKYSIPYCHLYDQGWTRLGCLGCPMGRDIGMKEDFERYPKYRALYVRAFDDMLRLGKERGKVYKVNFQNGEDVMKWWINAAGKAPNPVDMPSLFDDEDYEDETEEEL